MSYIEVFTISTSRGDLQLTINSNGRPCFSDLELAMDCLSRELVDAEPWQYCGLYDVMGNLESACSIISASDGTDMLQIDLSYGHYGAPQFRMFSQNALANLLPAEGQQSGARYRIFTSNGSLELHLNSNDDLQFADLELARDYLSRELVEIM
jgi:hypothetical protein